MACSEYLSKVLVGLVSPIWRSQGHRDRKVELLFFCGVAGIMGLRVGIFEFILCVWHVDLSCRIELWFVGRHTAHLWKESQGDVVEIRISLEVLGPVLPIILFLGYHPLLLVPSFSLLTCCLRLLLWCLHLQAFGPVSGRKGKGRGALSFCLGKEAVPWRVLVLL